jgi:hypothetical protein
LYPRVAQFAGLSKKGHKDLREIWQPKAKRTAFTGTTDGPTREMANDGTPNAMEDSKEQSANATRQTTHWSNMHSGSRY